MIFLFGSFEFRPDSGELLRNGRPVRLEPQPARALGLLLARAGELVTREELCEGIWGREVHVDFDRGLAYSIGQIRTALGDTADNPRFLKTLPRRGFSFIAPVDRLSVEPLAPADARTMHPADGRPRFGSMRFRLAAVAASLLFVAAATWLWSNDVSARRPVLAVASFDNETGDTRYDRFVAGLSDVVVSQLVSGSGDRLGVVGNLPVLRLPRNERDLGRIRAETHAHFVVLGQFQQDPAGIRVIAHLLELDGSTHLWANRFVRPADSLDGLDLQVAGAINRAVADHVLSRARPPSPSSEVGARF